MGLGSAILVKTYTGHSLFFHLSFKHQDDIQYYNYSSSFSPHFNIQYFNIFKIILNTNANANANARDLLSDVGKLSWSPNSLICISDIYQKYSIRYKTISKYTCVLQGEPYFMKILIWISRDFSHHTKFFCIFAPGNIDL